MGFDYICSVILLEIIMDREISKKVRMRERKKSILKYSMMLVGVCVFLSVVISFMKDDVSLDCLEFCTIDKGNVDVSVSASGVLSPVYEQIVTAPINTKIIEVYAKTGDFVKEGSPLLMLDLQSAQTDYNNMVDKVKMKGYELEQQRLSNNTFLSDLKMKIKVADMEYNRMLVETENEKFLDSIGSGTTDKVKEVQFMCKSKELGLQQLRTQYENESKERAAGYKIKELELSILKKELNEMKRTLNDAQIRAPRSASLIFISNQIGAQVAQGSQVAVIADLKHFKIIGEVAESYANRVKVGNNVRVRINGTDYEGVVSNIEPTAKNGVTGFSVQLDNDSLTLFRPGLKTDVYISDGVKENAMRIKNASFYKEPGTYMLYVRNGDELELRQVELGVSNYDYVEVVRGLHVGEQVVLNDMSRYNAPKLKIKY